MNTGPDRATKPTEIEITPAMIDRGLDWLFAFNRDYSDGRKAVTEILRLALPNPR